jgi:hypothetical protein
MVIPDFDDPWDEMRHLLSLLNFAHLDNLEEGAHEADAGAILAARDPQKAAELLYELMRVMTRLPRLHQQLQANRDVVARTAQIERRLRDTSKG